MGCRNQGSKHPPPLLQHLSGSSQPVRKAAGCSLALDCCTSAGSHCISRLLWSSVTSITHTAFTESQTHLDAVRSPNPFCLLQELSIWLSISSSLFLKCFGTTPLLGGPRLDLLATLEISSKALNWQQKERQRLLGTVSNWARHTVGRGCNLSPEMPL